MLDSLVEDYSKQGEILVFIDGRRLTDLIGITLTALLILAFVITSPISSAIATGTDGTKNSAFATNVNAAALGLSEVTSIGVQSTGKIIVAGTTGTGGGLLLRLNAAGTKDSSFPATQIGTTTSSDDRASGMKILSDDSIFLAGYFQSITQNSVVVASPLIAKFDAAGVIDTTFASGISDANTGLNKYFNPAQSTLESLTVDSTGRIIIGGSIKGKYVAPFSPRYQYPWARLSSSGAVDTTFVSPLTYDYASTYSMTLGPSDSIFSVGFFGSANSRVQKILADGTLATGSSFIPPSQFSTNTFRLDSVAVQPDGKVLIGGTDYGATAATSDNIASISRLNADGTSDGGFTPPVLTGTNAYPTIYTIVVQQDSSIVFGGNDFGYIKRINSSGAIDSSFATNMSTSGINGTVNRLAFNQSRELLAGGSFLQPANKVALYANAPTYTVTFTNGGGAGVDLVENIAQGTSLTLPSPTACPTSATDPCFTAPTGQRPNNWQVTSGTLSSGSSYPMTGQSVTPTSNVTLAARWTGGPVQYSATPFGSGGTAMSSIPFPNTTVGASNQITVYAYNSGTASTSISNETVGGSGVTRQGGTCNASGGTITAGGQCTLILQWNPTIAGALNAGSYSMQVSGPYNDAVTLTGTAATNKTVIFNAGNGTGTMPNQLAAFPTNLAANAFTRTGYSFSYWTMFSDGSGTQFLNQGSFPFNNLNPQNLYANWSADSHIVTFNTDGGSSVANGSFNTDGSMNLPAAPTKAGYTFNGWFATPTGGTALSSPYNPPGTSAITLYAQWSVDTSGGSGSNGNLPYTGNQTDQILGISGAILSIGLAITAFAMYRRRKG